MVGIWGVVDEQWLLGDLVSRIKIFFLKNSYYSCFFGLSKPKTSKAKT